VVILGLAIGVTAVVGALTGTMILHTSGVTLLMLTLAIVGTVAIRQS
jgi:branched-chain amino acid transport system permease protein